MARRAVLLTLSAVLAVLSLLLCALPPDGNEWDALAYHLAFPKLYLQAGRMVEIPFMHQSYFPPLQDMLYLWGLSVAGESAAKVTHWAVGMLTVLGAAGFLQRRGVSGAWGAVLILGAPAFLWQMFSAYADLATALYASLGMFALAYAVQEGNRRWLWLSGALMGFALATKYTALLTAGLWGLVGLVWLVRAGQARLLPTLVGAGLLAAAIGAPWYIRNALWTGNPVYPFAYEIFGGKNWSQAQADAYRNDQLKFGLGREPAQLLLAPWNLAANPAPFADPIGARVGERVFLLPSLGVGVLAMPSLWLSGGLTQGAGYLLAFVGLHTVGWFYLMQQVRYWLLLLPILAGGGLASVGRAGELGAVELCRVARVAGGLHAVADGERLPACAAARAARPRRLPRQTPANLPRRALPQRADASRRRRHPAGRDARLLPAATLPVGQRGTSSPHPLRPDAHRRRPRAVDGSQRLHLPAHQPPVHAAGNARSVARPLLWRHRAGTPPTRVRPADGGSIQNKRCGHSKLKKHGCRRRRRHADWGSPRSRLPRERAPTWLALYQSPSQSL
jgi:hypothetical protein